MLAERFRIKYEELKEMGYPIWYIDTQLEDIFDLAEQEHDEIENYFANLVQLKDDIIVGVNSVQGLSDELTQEIITIIKDSINVYE